VQFRAEEYYHVALERMRQAIVIHKSGCGSALAIYCGELAVESMLRAFRWKEDAAFEGRHDLIELLKASRLLRIDDEYMRAKGASDADIQSTGRTLRAALSEVPSCGTTISGSRRRRASRRS
jgi:flavin-dependent dehydrogenase